jgi:thymidylate synthase (FAD)
MVPWGLERHPEALEEWQRHVRAASEVYDRISSGLEQDRANGEPSLTKKESRRLLRSIARSVLPNATETKIAMTANARALRHFLKVRGAIPGDVEMRLVASELLAIMRNEAPSLFFDFRVDKFEDGSPIVVQTSWENAEARNQP